MNLYTFLKLLKKYGPMLTKAGPTIVKTTLIAGTIVYAYKWMYDLELKIIRLERDAKFD